MAVAGLLAHARRATAEHSWLRGPRSVCSRRRAGPLDAEDLELWATAQLMLAEDEAAVATLERVHDRYLERGETVRAARAAIWIGMNLAYSGAVGPASGWLGRAQRLLDEEPGDSAEQGYLLLPLVFRHEAAGEYEEAAAVAGQAAVVGQRFGDRDLLALAVHAQGHMLVMAGQVRAGMALLDEAMVTVTTDEPMPFVVGIVYCGVILACQSVFEVGRAREWTQALTVWVEGQRDVVAFTGRCLVHRAEILQLGGAWPDALNEARLASQRFVETGNPAAGLAHYRQGEVLRLLGRFDAAEAAYRDASRMGWEPQPGLAQLRLAQGRVDLALVAIRRASAEIAEPLKRAALLPAHVEIALAAGELDDARAACAELHSLAARYESRMLTAMVAHAEGATALAEGDADSALAHLRAAQQAVDRAGRALRGRPRPRAPVGGMRRLGRRRGRSARARGSLRDIPQAGSGTGSRATRARADQARARTLCARARGTATARARQDQPRDRRRPRHQRAHGRPPRAEHLRQAARRVTRSSDRVCVRARPRLTEPSGPN